MFDSVPEPIRAPATKEEKKRHRFYLAFSLNIFVLLYHLLHKLIMPLGISVMSGKPLQFLDWWWIYHVVLLVMLKRRKWDDAWMFALIFFGWGGVVIQLIASFTEYNWHRESLWVTAGSTIGVLIFLASLMDRRQKIAGRFYTSIVGGLLLGSLTQWTLYGFAFKAPQEIASSRPQELSKKYYDTLTDANRCGTMHFSLPIREGNAVLPPLEAIHDIRIAECGFQKSLAYWVNGAGIDVRNDTDSYLNVKLFYLEKTHWKPFKNFPLLIHDHVAIPSDDFKNYPAVMVISDSHPSKGILILLSLEQPPFSQEIGVLKSGKLEIDRQRVRAE